MGKLPKWEREFKARQRAQLTAFRKSKDKHLTSWDYTNGEFVRERERETYYAGWGHHRTRYVPVLKWKPNSSKPSV